MGAESVAADTPRGHHDAAAYSRAIFGFLAGRASALKYPEALRRASDRYSSTWPLLDPTKLGAPKDFVVTVRDLYVSAGAGFLVVSLGDITFIPGLPIKPAYYKIDVEFPDGEAPRVVGLS